MKQARFPEDTVDHLPSALTNVWVALVLVTAFGCQRVAEHEAGSISERKLSQLTAALDRATTQTDMNLASRKISEYWDAQLASVEKRIERKLDAEQLKRFLESVDGWRNYRDQVMKSQSVLFDGGSIQPLIANSSYSQITEKRVAELELILAKTPGANR